MTHWTLITGASEGLGVEFARIAAAEGRNLILAARSADKLEALASDLRTQGVEVVVLPTDLSDLDATEALWQAASDGRRIDVLVNNAGLGFNGDFADGQGWDRELSSVQVNVTALTTLMKRAVVHMHGLGAGRVLNVASLAGFLPGPNMAVYHASKAYVLFLSEAVAEELRGTGVTVTALCPGPTTTNFFDDADMHGVRLLKLAPVGSARGVALAGWRAAMSGKRVIVPGLVNKAFAFSPRITPRSLVTRIASVIMGRGKS